MGCNKIPPQNTQPNINTELVLIVECGNCMWVLLGPNVIIIKYLGV